jgi:hypothetical protein
MTSPRPDPIKRVSARKYRGIGDLVEAVAKPVARVIDRVAHTRLTGCQACAKRRETLNRIFPLP